VSHVRLSLLLAAWGSVVPARLTAQGDQIAAGIQAFDAHDFAAARSHFDAALRRDPASYEANWRLALVLIDIAKQTPDRFRSPARDSVYRDAESYARRAVAAKADGAEGHFALANAIGRASLSMRPGERVRRALEVRTEALRTIELEPRHDGAWHILGRWNAEVKRLPATERFFARTFFGASAFGTASWDEAERDLRLAVQYAPTRIVHRFDLAKIMSWRQEWAAAKQELDAVAALPSVDVSDTSYKRQARDLMLRVKEKLPK
jgi:tetratricopeptide (TPR) repeat protein